MKGLEGKVALITGGSSGIGRAAAIAFAREGAKVVIAARGVDRGLRVVEEIRSAGGDALFVGTDVSKARDVEGLIGKAVGAFGRIDCAFNNAAGLDGAFSLTADFGEDEFDRAVAVNLKGVWLCMKYEIRQMLGQDRQGGAIVNTSSVNGLGGARLGAPYAATKAGILALTKSAALEYSRQGIRINALVAGGFRTPMLEEVFQRASGGDPKAAQAVEAQYSNLAALGRIGEPEEAAEVAVWLCSDESSYVVGHSMIVDGGMSANVR